MRNISESKKESIDSSKIFGRYNIKSDTGEPIRDTGIQLIQICEKCNWKYREIL